MTRLRQSAKRLPPGWCRVFLLLVVSLLSLCLGFSGEQAPEQERAISRSSQGPPIQDYHERLQMLYRNAESLAQLGEYEKALNSYQEALRLQRQNQDRRGESATLMAIGDTYLFRMGQPEVSLDYYEESLKIKQAIKDRKGEPEPLHQLAYAQYTLGRIDLAEELYRQTLTLSRAAKNRRAEGTALNGLGNCLLAKGRAEEAITFYQQALPLRKKVKDQQGTANTTYNIGRAHVSLGQDEKALDYFQQALKLRGDNLDLQAEAETLIELGRVTARLKRPDQAEKFFLETVPVARRVKSPRLELEALYGVARIALVREQPAKAISYFKQSLEVFEKLGTENQRARCQVLISLGSAYYLAGQHDDAIRSYSEGVRVAHELQESQAVAEGLLDLGQIYALRHQPHYALGCYFQARLILEKLTSPIVRIAQERIDRMRSQIGEEVFTRVAETVRSNLAMYLREATGIGTW